MSINIHLIERINKLDKIEKNVAMALLKELNDGYKNNSLLEELILEEIDYWLEEMTYETSKN